MKMKKSMARTLKKEMDKGEPYAKCETCGMSKKFCSSNCK